MHEFYLVHELFTFHKLKDCYKIKLEFIVFKSSQLYFYGREYTRTGIFLSVKVHSISNFNKAAYNHFYY